MHMLKTTITTKQPIEIPIQYKNVYTAAIATMHCVTLRRVCHQKMCYSRFGQPQRRVERTTTLIGKSSQCISAL